MNNCYKIAEIGIYMVLLTMVVILTVVIPIIRWIDRKGYDTLLVAALIIPLIFLFFSFNDNFYDSFYIFVDDTTGRPTNYVAIILTIYAVYFTYAFFTYAVLFSAHYLFWVKYKKQSRNKVKRRKQNSNKPIRRTRTSKTKRKIKNRIRRLTK